MLHVLTETGGETCFQISPPVSHIADLVFQHTLDFITHGFGACGTEMDMHPIGGSADFLYKGRAVICLFGDIGGCVGVLCTHRLSSCVKIFRIAFLVISAFSVR